MVEVIARLRALFRRTEPAQGPTALSWGGVSLDPTLYVVATDRAHRELTPTEYRPLELFMHNPERVLSHADVPESGCESRYLAAAFSRSFYERLTGG
jgi:DNA-binding response OmpR family regulator